VNTKMKTFVSWSNFLIVLILVASCSSNSKSGGDPIAGMQIATVSRTAAPATAEPPAQPTVDNGPLVVLQDGFSDPQSGWEVFDDDLGSSGYEMGGYLVEARQKAETMWGVAGKTFEDIRIDVDARMITAPENGNNAFGVDCRIQPNGDGYSFHISSDGWFAIVKFVDEEAIEIVEWTESSAILLGDEINHLTATCQGNQLTFLVNDVEVAQVQDDTYSSGDISLSATTFEEESTSILFDDVIVLQLVDPSTYEDGGRFSLSIMNPTDLKACYVYISPKEDDEWGEDWLASDEYIEPGKTMTFTDIPGSLVDVKVLACDYMRLLDTYSVDLSSTISITLVEPALVKSYSFIKEEDWPLGVVEGGMTSINNSDYYSISAVEGNKLVSVFSNYSTTDSIIRSDASLVRSGAGGMGIYGVTCRMQRDNSGIFFAVRGDGQASIQKIVKGSLVSLTEWESSEIINPGIDSNYIEGVCVGSTFKLFVNGGFITSVEDPDFTSGRVGAAVFSPPGATTQADFDFVDVYDESYLE
jgi:hypothetical protein